MKKVIALLCFLFVVGCSHYEIKYDTYMPNSNPPRSLFFKDTNFSFEFLPVANGVDFLINNLTDKPAFMQWDRCYFIDPNGISSKALNTDLLYQNKETSNKSTYESPIPAKGSFFRFTTSSTNVSRFTSIKIDAYYATIFKNNNIIRTDITKNEFYNYAPYWPPYESMPDSTHKVVGSDNKFLEETVKGSGEKRSLEKIKNYITYSNNTGLGLGIKFDNTIMDYKFDFKFKNVTIFKINDNSKTIYKTASDTNNWKWSDK